MESESRLLAVIVDELPIGNEVGEDAVDEGAPSGSARDNCEPSQSVVGKLLQQRMFSRYGVVAPDSLASWVNLSLNFCKIAESRRRQTDKKKKKIFVQTMLKEN